MPTEYSYTAVVPSICVSIGALHFDLVNMNETKLLYLHQTLQTYILTMIKRMNPFDIVGQRSRSLANVGLHRNPRLSVALVNKCNSAHIFVTL